MTKKEFAEIERYMLSQMRDSAHDRHHVYRVLNAAIDIYEDIFEKNSLINTDAPAVDFDVLVAACLLHDIGREKQMNDPDKLNHAKIGGKMAYEYLLSRKWTEPKAAHAKACISSHRYRGKKRPESIEAKILYDADKLDACGALGIARTLIYGGQVSEPLYIIGDGGTIAADSGGRGVAEGGGRGVAEGENIVAGGGDLIVTDGGGAEVSSFLQEYNYKLKKVYDSFYTERARVIALERRKTAVDFYNDLYAEIADNYKNGISSHMKYFRE